MTISNSALIIGAQNYTPDFSTSGVVSNTYPKEGEKIVPFSLSFANQNIWFIDLTIAFNTLSLSQFRGLYIDNTQSFNDVFVYLPETGFEICVKAGYSNLVPIINVRYNYFMYVYLRGQVYDSVSTVNIFAMNFMLPPFNTFNLFNPPTPVYFVDLNIMQRANSLDNGTMLPIPLAYDTNSTASVLLGGCTIADGSGHQQFLAVTCSTVFANGALPIETSRITSATFQSTLYPYIGDCSWCLSPDRSQIIFYAFAENSSNSKIILCMYNIASQSFGSLFTFSFSSPKYVADQGKVTWIDNSHFVINDGQATTGAIVTQTGAGVRLFKYNGAIIDLGYTQLVSGLNTLVTLNLDCTFVPYKNGLIFIYSIGNTTSATMYGIYLTLSGDTLNHGAAYTILSGYSTGTGSAPSFRFVNTSAAFGVTNEFTFIYSTVISTGFFSFQAFDNSATITRAYQNFSFYTSPAIGVSYAPASAIMYFDVYFPLFLQIYNPTSGTNYGANIYAMTPTDVFILGSPVTVAPNLLAESSDFMCYPLDNGRILLAGGFNFYFDLTQGSIINLTANIQP